MTIMYDGAVELVFHERLGRKQHVYTVDDKIVDNVTKVLGIIAKPALLGWVAKMCGEYVAKNVKPGAAYKMDEVQIDQFIAEMKTYRFKKSKEAMAIGTIVHKFAEMYARTMKPDFPANPQARIGVEAFLKFWEEYEVEPIDIERRVLSRKDNYCGTVDLVANLTKGGAKYRAIIDYKVSNAIYPENRYQVAAYRRAYEEETGDTIDSIIVVRFDKATGEVEVDETNDTRTMNRYGKTFCHALKVYKQVERDK